jgi:hypothetical protein
MPALAPSLMWQTLLEVLPEPQRRAALQSPHLPREALLYHASDLVDDGEPEDAIALLEPLLLAASPRDDELANHNLDTLCNAYDERGNARRRKRALLRHVSALPGRPALGMLEVQLLLAGNRHDEARDRARFFRAQLRRRGDQDLNPELLEFYDSLAEDPQRAMSDVSFEMEGGEGRALAAWLDLVRDRPLPRMELESVPDGTSTDALLQEPAALDPAREAWHAAFDRPKPFGIQPLPMLDTEDPWELESEQQ